MVIIAHNVIVGIYYYYYYHYDYIHECNFI